MSLPYFFIEQLTASSRSLILNEEQSKHIIQVLRMQKGDEVLLTDGKGNKAHARILDDHRKRCEVEIITVTKEEEAPHNVSIAISLIKNASRFEWFLEKATEIGINEIIPLICERTEKEKFRLDRLQNILVSAMLQSQQCWLPRLGEPVSLIELINQKKEGNRFIAHCLQEKKQQRNGGT
jgi:16S rRNA (uracil1498-N3)-methyltransferase